MRGRTAATGRGVFFGIREATLDTVDMKKLGFSPGIAGKTAVVQGLGNVGYYAAHFLADAGAKLVGLAEREGSIAAPGGLDLEAVMAHRKATGSILGFPGAKNLPDRYSALELECDILVPAALENQITDENIDRIRAKIIGEGANGPITSGASAPEELVPQLVDFFRDRGAEDVSELRTVDEDVRFMLPSEIRKLLAEPS